MSNWVFFQFTNHTNNKWHQGGHEGLLERSLSVLLHVCLAECKIMTTVQYPAAPSLFFFKGKNNDNILVCFLCLSVSLSLFASFSWKILQLYLLMKPSASVLFCSGCGTFHVDWAWPKSIKSTHANRYPSHSLPALWGLFIFPNEIWVADCSYLQPLLDFPASLVYALCGRFVLMHKIQLNLIESLALCKSLTWVGAAGIFLFFFSFFSLKKFKRLFIMFYSGSILWNLSASVLVVQACLATVSLQRHGDGEVQGNLPAPVNIHGKRREDLPCNCMLGAIRPAIVW